MERLLVNPPRLIRVETTLRSVFTELGYYWLLWNKDADSCLLQTS